MQNAARNQIFTRNNLKHRCLYLNEYVFTDHENTTICLVTLAPWVHHLSRDIYFSIFLWSVHSHNQESIEVNFTVILQVPHYFHSLCPLCHPGLSQRKANFWRGRIREKEKSNDK